MYHLLKEAAEFGWVYNKCVPILGGLTAVIWTDFAQTGIMLAGATALSVLSKPLFFLFTDIYISSARILFPLLIHA